MKAYWETGCTAPHILDLATRWRWVVLHFYWIHNHQTVMILHARCLESVCSYFYAKQSKVITGQTMIWSPIVLYSKRAQQNLTFLWYLPPEKNIFYCNFHFLKTQVAGWMRQISYSFTNVLNIIYYIWTFIFTQMMMVVRTSCTMHNNIIKRLYNCHITPTCFTMLHNASDKKTLQISWSSSRNDKCLWSLSSHKHHFRSDHFSCSFADCNTWK